MRRFRSPTGWEPFRLLAFSVALGAATGMEQAAAGQQAGQAAAQAVAYVGTEGVTLTGSLSVANGRAVIGNNSTVTAGDKPAMVSLARGGTLRICVGTSVQLSRDAAPLGGAVSAGSADSAGLMVALDNGAIEAKYPAGRYSDVLLTPDLRILVSGPGAADLKFRVNRKGDTCVDNRGTGAPYVTVSSLMDGGVYRVQANQRVLFEHGSLQQVVDREPEECGCPDSALEQDRATTAAVGGPSSTPSDTAFPVAVSEGLVPPPVSSTPPVNGQPHVQVMATLSSDTPPAPPPTAAQGTPPVTGGAGGPGGAEQKARPGFLHRIGHLLSRLFGS